MEDLPDAALGSPTGGGGDRRLAAPDPGRGGEGDTLKAERRRRTIDRYLSRCGMTSREEAIRLVRAGRVRVNGQVV
ncbi:MAG: S4 domain-containing protein, partial [Planctomycetota bacterium]